MDIARPANVKRKRMRQAGFAALALAALVVVSIGVARLKPAAYGVERTSLWIDTVKRGRMVREVRGTGTLVPEDTRWIAAMTTGQVDRIRLQPGTPVKEDSVILELSNPQLEQERQDTALKVKAAEANLANLRVQLQNELLQQQASIAGIEADHKRATMQLEVNEQLAAEQLIAAILVKQSKLDVDQLAERLEIAKKQLQGQADSAATRLAVLQSEVDQAAAMASLKDRQVQQLQVRAGVHGVLQLVPVQVGQQVAPGANLARVADPSRLKVELKVPETQAKDIQIGQAATIDTRNGLVPGSVMRVDPAVQNGTVTVDLAPTASWPKGARPDLTVDGTIELERIADVLYVGRPSTAQEQSLVGLFKLFADGTATRVQVKVGRMSANTVEVLSGLGEGDQVVLSDASAWEGYDRIQLR
jgi:HlyD family secretion protein